MAEKRSIMSDYNGWKNRQTWNVSLWLNSTEPLYREACAFMRAYRGRTPYLTFIKHHMALGNETTPDGVKWLSTRLDYKALNQMMRELAE